MLDGRWTVCEVYPDGAWCEADAPAGGSAQKLRADHRAMCGAFDRPLLEEFRDPEGSPGVVLRVYRP